ncbi:MAG: AmmeMemoRadiSam system radical SAM enzyme [Deltaproteobacteria bacterium]|nr:MAG: AmmeMemoRadiSam system radical SAM enzyme [Deltaproteobacteria bacterium]
MIHEDEPTVETFPGRWWHAEGDRFVCDLCPRACHLRPGQRGFCYVRMATEDGVALTTYGRSSGFCIDPIEKKPLFHFLPGTPILSFGTAGCNLGCRFCQNWDISKARQDDRLMDRASPEQLAEAAVAHGCRSVAFTYNDPVIFAEYAIDVAEACHQRDIRTVAVTAGYISAGAREEFFAGVDAANVDLKAFTERFYQRLCYGALEPVKETLQYLVHHTDTWVELTTLLIPGENDSDHELHELTAWVREALGPHVPLHFTAYHPDYRLDRPPTPASTLLRARRIGLEEGLWFVYTGNVRDVEGNSTWCPSCGSLLIQRDWYQLGAWGMDPARPGRCASCGTAVPGVFEARPGTWGGRRQPIRIGS